MQSGYFKSGSASIYYELHGEGEEVLVLLHGNGGNCKNFKNQIPFFSKKYKNGVPLGIRTLDPLIKSQLLYQLS